jgi:hypothetical protein
VERYFAFALVRPAQLFFVRVAQRFESACMFYNTSSKMRLIVNALIMIGMALFYVAYSFPSSACCTQGHTALGSEPWQ